MILGRSLRFLRKLRQRLHHRADGLSMSGQTLLAFNRLEMQELGFIKVRPDHPDGIATLGAVSTRELCYLPHTDLCLHREPCAVQTGSQVERLVFQSRIEARPSDRRIENRCLDHHIFWIVAVAAR